MSDFKQVSVSIQYCSMWGNLPQAVSLTEALLEQFGMDLKEIVLIPSMGGIFEVIVDGELVHSKKKTGRLPLIADIKKIVRQRVLT